MLRTILLSKIHRATVTECNINYEGSITVDPILLEAAGMKEFEKVDIFNINTGARFSTYTMAGRRGSHGICVNGAGARLSQVGDKIIIVNYGLVEDQIGFLAELPTIVLVDDNNKIMK